MKKFLFLLMFMFSVIAQPPVYHYAIVPDGAGDLSGDSWTNGMDSISAENWINDTMTAGDVLVVKGTTWNVVADLNSSARNGTATAPCKVFCVKAATTNEDSSIVVSDLALDSADRVTIVFDDGENILTGQFTTWAYFNLSGPSTYLFYGANYGGMIRCSIVNTYESGIERYTVYLGAGGYLLGCHLTAPNILGARVTSGCRLLYNHFYGYTNATYGKAIFMDGSYISVFGNKISNSLIGIWATADHICTFSENTFFDVDTVLRATTDNSIIFVNNGADSCNVIARWTTQTDGNIFINNGEYRIANERYVGIDTAACFMDYWIINGDPKLNTPFDGTVDTGSAWIDSAFTDE